MASAKVAGCVLLPLLVWLAGCSTDPRAVSRKYVENGNAYFSRGKYKEASLLYRRALQKDGKYAEAWYRLGLTNNQLGIYADARKDFARAMDLDAANVDAVARLGDLDLLFYAADQKGNKALLADLKDLTQRLLRRDKKSYDGLRLAGEIALIEKDLATAIQRFEEANQSRPYQRQLVLALAQALLADHQDERAEKLVLEDIQHDQAASAIYDLLYTNYLRTRRTDAAEEILRKKIANNPAEGAYVMQLAYHYYMTGRGPEMTAALERLTSKPSAFPDARLQAGDFYARIRELDQALHQYQLGEKENSKRARTYQKKIVEVLASQGKIEQATGLVGEILRRDPKDPEALALHATLGMAKGDPKDLKQAIAELEPLARTMPGNALVRYNLGRAYLAVRPADLGQAGTQFNDALRIDPKHTGAQLGLAEVELARKNSAQALAQVEHVLSAEPGNLPAILLRAQARINMSEYEKAREDLATALAMEPKSNEARFILAQLDVREQRYQDASGEFQRLRTDGDPRGFRGIVDCLALQGQWEQAVQIVERQVREKPDAQEFRSELASLMLRSGRYREALAQYQVLISQNPNSEEFFLRLGEAKAQLGDARGAMQALERAGEIAPSDAAPELDLAILNDQIRNFGDARRAYESALRRQPDNPTALNNLAYLEAEQGVDLDQALVYAQRARAQRPDDTSVLDTLGLIYVKKNLTEDGARILREAVKRQPGNAAFRLHLALALYQKGDRLMARRELEAARRNKPNDKQQNQIQELLAKVG